MKPEERQLTLMNTEIEEISNDVLAEIRKAERKFPEYPVEVLPGLAIVGEEYGEALQAGVDYTWGRLQNAGKVRKELLHTGAMIFRTLAQMDRIESFDKDVKEKTGFECPECKNPNTSKCGSGLNDIGELEVECMCSTPGCRVNYFTVQFGKPKIIDVKKDGN